LSGFILKLVGLLRDRNFILSLALALGFLLGEGALWTERLVLPVLAFVMMLSTTSVTGGLFRSPRRLLAPLLAGVTMNYVVLGGLILLLSSLLVLEEPLRVGFVVLSLLGLSAGFQVKLFTTLVELIIIPLALSRVLVHTGVASRIAPVRGTLINWSFFLVVYTVVGLNRGVFLSRPSSLIPAAAITATTTYLLGYAIDRAGRFLRVDPKRVVSMVLLGTSKNAGFAAGLALTLFGRQTAIPSTIQTILMLSYVIFLDLKARRSRT